MRRSPNRWPLGVSVAAMVAGWMVACGARSQLGAPISEEGGVDGELDAFDVRSEDALPPIDGFVDSPIPTDCVEAGITYVYIITSQNELFSFYPPTLAFTKIGDLNCPAQNGATPYSMAVDRKGVAYSVFDDGELFRISTANASCQATSYVPPAQGDAFYTMGMGFAGDVISESLYVADARFSANSMGLATIDTTTFTRSFIADFQPELPRCELTGTGNGRLFAFCLNLSGGGSQIAEVDRSTAKVIAVDQLLIGESNDAFAWAFWGGYFWIFTAPNNTSTVTRYDPGTHAELNMTTLGSTIVGAGVSTCAPQ